MVSRKLPPLNALKAFEATARLKSVSAAAREVNVSPSAISQQIRHLEDWLGVKLIRRTNGGIVTTEHGQDYLLRATEALNIVDDATRNLFVGGYSKRLRITVLPSLASHWLMPKLGEFLDLHPKIDVEVDSSNSIVDFEKDDFDLGIRYGYGKYPGVTAEPLLREALAPVCHPDFLNGKHSSGIVLKTPQDLTEAKLLRDAGGLAGQKYDCRDWFDYVGMTNALQHWGPCFTDTNLTIQAALKGEGVILGRCVLVSDLIEAGHLACPFNMWLPERAQYHIVYSRLRTPRPIVREFIKWIKMRASQFSERMEAADGVKAMETT